MASSFSKSSATLGGARRDLVSRLLVNESSNATTNSSSLFSTNPSFQENHQYGGGASAISTTTTTGVEDFERDICRNCGRNAFENQLIVLNFLLLGAKVSTTF